MFKSFFSKSSEAKSISSFKDPICGMKTTDKITHEYKGKTYGFCSDHCRAEFEKEPEKYSNN